MKAMILAAGFGRRLLPVTKRVPKTLVAVKGRPALIWIVEQLERNGFEEILINTHHLHGRIEEFVAKLNTSCRITLSHEPEILGTGGGLLNARAFLKDESCYVCNGDILSDLDIPDFIACHRSGGNEVTLAVNDIESPSMLLVDANGKFCGRLVGGKWTLHADPCGSPTAKGFAGAHLIEPSFFARNHPTNRFSIINRYTDLVRQGVTISTYDTKGAYWIDIGTWNSLERANREFKGFRTTPPRR